MAGDMVTWGPQLSTADDGSLTFPVSSTNVELPTEPEPECVDLTTVVLSTPGIILVHFECLQGRLSSFWSSFSLSFLVQETLPQVSQLEVRSHMRRIGGTTFGLQDEQHGFTSGIHSRDPHI